LFDCKGNFEVLEGCCETRKDEMKVKTMPS
jgi:hypothetical protein